MRQPIPLEASRAREEAAERRVKEEAEELRVQCVDKIEQLTTLAKNSLKSNEPAYAIQTLLPCRSIMVSKDAKSTYERAEKALDLKIKREAAAKSKAEAAAKKKEGVRLGMSPDDAIASSWGKPDRVNRSTSQYGVREQWVYEGGGYLYFVNGVLDSIQN